MGGIILSVAGLALSAGIFIYQESQASAAREAAWQGVKNLFDMLARSENTRDKVIFTGWDRMWGRFRFVVILGTNRLGYVDFHPGNTSIRFWQLDRTSEMDSFTVTLSEERDPAEVRSMLRERGVMAGRDTALRDAPA